MWVQIALSALIFALGVYMLLHAFKQGSRLKPEAGALYVGAGAGFMVLSGILCVYLVVGKVG